MANKRKLNYRIHNPNPAEATAEYIARVLVEVNRSKIGAVIRNFRITAPSFQDSSEPKHPFPKSWIPQNRNILSDGFIRSFPHPAQ